MKLSIKTTSSLGGADPARGLLGKPRVKGDWLERINNYYWVNNLLRLHQELPFWILHWDGKKGLTWMDLTRSSAAFSPSTSKFTSGKEAKRDDYYWESLKRAGRDREFVVGDLMGFSDFFYPLPADPKGRTFFYGGQFLTEELDWDGIAWRWRELTGQLPASANPDFMRFVRMCLRIPVIEAPVLKAIEEFLGLFSELVSTDHADVRLHEAREEAEARGVRSRLAQQRLGRPRHQLGKFLLTPWYTEGKLEDWRSEEMGICRLPTTNMALMPVYPKNQTLDPVQTMVKKRADSARLHSLRVADAGDGRQSAARLRRFDSHVGGAGQKRSARQARAARARAEAANLRERDVRRQHRGGHRSHLAARRAAVSVASRRRLGAAFVRAARKRHSVLRRKRHHQRGHALLAAQPRGRRLVRRLRSRRHGRDQAGQRSIRAPGARFGRPSASRSCAASSCRCCSR